MFPPGPHQALQQQFMQGSYLAQQGMMLEMNGNVMGAAQFFDQAAQILSQCLAVASQYQVPISDQGWFSLAWCHFNAARTKAMIGWGAAAPAHLMQAHAALNNAIGMNPSCGPYHSAMGVLLATEGNAPAATQAFMRAVQLNPADGFSQYMLAILNQAQGNVAAGNQYFAVAQQYAGSLPPPQQTVQAHKGGEGFDWNGLVSTAGQFFKAVNSVSSLFSQDSGQQAPSFGGGGGWGGGGWGGGDFGGFNW
jgi:tetratricopeptide (TPR) repeat protein